MSQWVQSKYSKDAKKWEVFSIRDSFYRVLTGKCGNTADLPRDEYIECDPPEQWEVCTRDMFFGTPGFPCGPRANAPAGLQLPSGCHWAWSEKDPDALVIQRRKP